MIHSVLFRYDRQCPDLCHEGDPYIVKSAFADDDSHAVTHIFKDVMPHLAYIPRHTINDSNAYVPRHVAQTLVIYLFSHFVCFRNGFSRSAHLCFLC